MNEHEKISNNKTGTKIKYMGQKVIPFRMPLDSYIPQIA
jgi:hypothetical protein